MSNRYPKGQLDGYFEGNNPVYTFFISLKKMKRLKNNKHVFQEKAESIARDTNLIKSCAVY